MKKAVRVIFSAVALSILCVYPFASLLYADTFNVSYTLTEGGFRLELNPATPYKGVKIDVSTDTSEQYEILQQIITPMENRSKPGEIIRDNFVMRRISDGNATGTFYVQPSDIAVSTIDRIYTSPRTGSAMNFTLVYGISHSEELAAGDYFGRLAFTLRPINSTRPPVTKFLDVNVSVAQKAESKAAVAIAPAKGLNTITLNSSRVESEFSDVAVTINTSLSHEFSIKQLLTTPLESTEGHRLNPEALNFIVREIRKGTGANRDTALSLQPQTVYTSGPDGAADSQFMITYSLKDTAGQTAGTYKSRLQYILDEAGSGQSSLGRLDVEVELEPILSIEMSTLNDKPAFEFQKLKPKDPPQKDEIILEVKTNLGKQYQVIQHVSGEMMDKAGNILSERSFKLVTESVETIGTLKFPVQADVKKGDTVLFVSDKTGSPAKFKVLYELSVPRDFIPGEYTTSIMYSVSEM